MTKKALDGVKIIEFCECVAGPYCGKLMADMGAEVIKIEKPGTGDKARSWGPFPNDIPHYEKSGLFLFLNTNKSSVTLDLDSAAGLKIFKALLKWADVLIENNPPKKMTALGLNYAKVQKINPQLIMTSITPSPDRALERLCRQ
jgi:crotonobetainyl-CoA:carnitine CoA-transferase CaiB-like acyl-CoA transferase